MSYRFTELYVEELESKEDLQILIVDYLKGLSVNKNTVQGIITCVLSGFSLQTFPLNRKMCLMHINFLLLLLTREDWWKDYLDFIFKAGNYGLPWIFLRKLLSWPKSSFGFFCKMVEKNSNFLANVVHTELINHCLWKYVTDNTLLITSVFIPESFESLEDSNSLRRYK